MFAIIQLGNSQFKVQEGDVIEAPLMREKAGNSIEIDHVLLVGKNDDVQIGQPYVKGAKVKAEVVGPRKGKKVLTLKYRRRKDSAVKSGHREKWTALSISKISL